MLSPSDNGSGYLIVRLYRDNVKKRYYIHRLVYESFNGHIENNMEVDHIDNNKSNNSLSNLQLLTRKENMLKLLVDNDRIRSDKKCLDCNSIIKHKSTRCNQCKNNHKRNKTNNKLKTIKHELTDLIKIFPLSHISTLYGVSDKTIKSWIDRLEIKKDA